MDEFWKTLLIACIPSLLTGMVTYFVAHKNASAQIKVLILLRQRILTRAKKT